MVSAYVSSHLQRCDRAHSPLPAPHRGEGLAFSGHGLRGRVSAVVHGYQHPRFGCLSDIRCHLGKRRLAGPVFERMADDVPVTDDALTLREVGNRPGYSLSGGLRVRLTGRGLLLGHLPEFDSLLAGSCLPVRIDLGAVDGTLSGSRVERR